MEHNRRHEHPGTAGPVGEEQVAKHPGEHAPQEHRLDAVAGQKQGHQQHEADLAHLAEGHHRLAAEAEHLLDVHGADVFVGLRVVDGQRDADQEAGRGEGGEGGRLEQADGVEAEELGDADRLSLALGWAGGQREGIDPEQGRHGRGHEEGEVRLAGVVAGGVAQEERLNAPGQPAGGQEPRQERAHRDPGGDPADRAPDPDERKLLLRLGEVIKADRIHECQGRHIAEAGGEQQPIETRWIGRAGGGEQEAGIEQVQAAEHHLARQESVGHEPHEQGSDDRRDGAGGVGLADDRVDGRLAPVWGGKERGQVFPHWHRPGTPDEELQKHHHAQPRHHSRSPLTRPFVGSHASSSPRGLTTISGPQPGPGIRILPGARRS